METTLNEPLYRHELKYLVSSAEIELLKTRIRGILQIDPHVATTDSYAIRSLYFDDLQDRCYYENENGNDHRAKYRIRIYNGSDSRISLECKRKDRGKTLKIACLIDRATAESLINGIVPRNLSEFPLLVQGLCADMLANRMRAAIIVEYERIPYLYRDGNVRITFDTNISSSKAISSFFDKTLPKRPILERGTQLLEVKFDEFLPDVIYHALNLGTLQQTAFSKYYLCRKYTL